MKKTRFATLVLLCFVGLSLMGVLNHELWRDEMQGWLIARDSTAIATLLQNQRYESGRSFVSFLGFFAISQVTRNPLAMQLFHLGIAATTVYLIARFSPFTRWQKIALTFSYYSFFEYSLICRDYASSVLLIVVFCVLFPLRDRTRIPLACCLFLVANTHFYALLIAIALGFPLFFRDSIFLKPINPNFKNTQTPHTRHSIPHPLLQWDFFVSVGVWLAGLVIAIGFMLPPADGTITPQAVKPFSFSHLASTLAIVWKSYAPMPGITLHFWNTNILDDGTAAVLSVGLLLAAIAGFIRQPSLLIAYLFGTLSIVYITYSKFPGTMRQWGYLFILFVACSWLAQTLPTQLNWTDSNPFWRWSNWLALRRNSILNGLLLIQLIAGGFAFASDLQHPFSQAKAAAQFIQTQASGDQLLIGDPDWAALPISGYLDQPIYYPASKGFGTFIKFNTQRRDRSPAEVVNQINAIAATSPQNILLIRNQPLDPIISSALSRFPIELARFTGAIVQDENYYLYKLQR
ncbi:MAG: hypothetical protein IGS48_14885 [Oscillatoriales cyanobacterium C42_A2020_001]|nr:hypothetical protein [Leptolyngbyaceae cyanobacterium C42_A2020_001]